MRVSDMFKIIQLSKIREKLSLSAYYLPFTFDKLYNT